MSTVGSGTSWKSSDGVPDQFPKGLRVLVVDDDPTCLRILEKMLRNCLYEVTKCNRAEIALQYLRDNKNGFDVVISDVHMPDMDGFKLLKQVGLEMDLPVIMMSADDSKSVVMKGVTHGACDYLIKPVRMEALKNIWQHVVRKRKSDSKDKDFEQRDRDFEQSGSVEDGERKHKQLLDDADYSSSANEGNWKSSRKRKEEDDEGEDNDDTSTMRKPRVAWSVELHQQFVGAVNQLGMDKAVPKKILELMNVPGLTRENVASHLQKYRLYLRRASVSQHQNGLNGSFMGPADANFAAMSSLHGFDFQALATSQIPPQSLASLQAAALCRPPPSKSPLTVVDSRNLFSFQSPKLLGNNNTEQMNLLHGIPTNMEPKQLASLNQSVQVNSQTSENNPMIMQMNSRAQMLNEINSTPVSTVPSSVGQPILLNGLARSGSSPNGIYTAVSEGSPMVDFSMNNGSQLLGSSYSNVRHIVPSSLTSKGMMMMQGEVNLGGVKKSRGFVPNHEFFNEPQQYRATTEWGLQNVGSTFDPVARGNVEVLPSTYVQPGLSSVAHKSWQDNTGEAMFSRADGGGHISNPNFGLPINPFVCKFLEVSKLSFSPEYGPKLKEAYVMVKHLPKIHTGNDRRRCCSCQWFSCCRDNWQKVWAVLISGFLAFLKDPFETQPLDIIVFDVLPTSNGNAEGHALLAK